MSPGAKATRPPTELRSGAPPPPGLVPVASAGGLRHALRAAVAASRASTCRPAAGRGIGRLSGTRCDPRRSRPLPVQREFDRAQCLYLRLELDPKLRPDTLSSLDHHRHHVSGRRLAVVLDEVGVLDREPRPPDAHPATPGRFEQLARG